MVTTSRVNKLFALASVSALTGLLAATAAAGCTSETVADATIDASPPPNAEEAGDLRCYKDDPFDATAVPYKKARVIPGACSENVTKVLDPFFSSKDVNLDQVQRALQTKESMDCSNCVFGSDGDSWGPFAISGDRLIINIGGCIEVVSGSEACGRAFHQLDGCLSSVCKGCTSEDRSLCQQHVEGTACNDASQALVTACGGQVNLSSYIRECIKSVKYDIYGPILKLCVGSGTASDAGSD